MVRASLLACLSLLAGTRAGRGADAPAVPLRALLIGGGYSLQSNAAQIEGHVKFVASILPPATDHVVLFAGGKTDQATVAYKDLGATAEARHILALLLDDDDLEAPPLERAPKLGVEIDGSSRLRDIHQAMGKFSAPTGEPPPPVLLYFAGHGGYDEKSEPDSAYSLWDDGFLKVRTLAAEVARLPRQTPVLLVMAQCHSGVFADLLFRGGNLKGEPTGQNLVGFFAANKLREASGCSTATGKADYQDFSSYFFGALCGHDRFGGVVKGADFDGDGTVSLHEALCYTLIHDPSIDTPTCTSDVFLERFVPMAEGAVPHAPYKEVWQAGTAGQRAVLDALTEGLDLVPTERRAVSVARWLRRGWVSEAQAKKQDEAKRNYNTVREAAFAPLAKRWPALDRSKKDAGYTKALKGATEEIAKDPAPYRALVEAGAAYVQADEAVENQQAALARFASVYAHIVKAQELRAHGKEETKAQYERLWKAEQGTLPINVSPSAPVQRDAGKDAKTDAGTDAGTDAKTDAGCGDGCGMRGRMRDAKTDAGCGDGCGMRRRMWDAGTDAGLAGERWPRAKSAKFAKEEQKVGRRPEEEKGKRKGYAMNLEREGVSPGKARGR